MSSYAQSITWWHRIGDAILNDGFTDVDKHMAASWVTCACGEQDARIPRDEVDGEPLDADLAELGYRFYMCVEDDRYAEAFATLAAIEQRAATLLGEPVSSLACETAEVIA